MSVAFVFSGGASLGAIQVGMVQALDEADIRPELIVGTSVGAINGAWLAGGQPVEDLAALWRSLRRSDIFPLRPLVGLRGFLGHRSHLVPSSGLRRLLHRHLTFDRLEDARIPFSVVAADIHTGEAVRFHDGPAVDTILASAALPGVFAPVRIGDRTFIDGGVIDNTPITKAIDAGASEVWVLSTGYSCALPAPPKSALGVAMHAVALLVQQRLVLELRQRSYPVPVHLIPPLCPVTVSPIDFSQSSSLMDRARAGTSQWLRNGRPDAMSLLRLHDHGGSPEPAH